MTSPPPGQRESAEFNRFGLTPFTKRFPSNTEIPVLELGKAIIFGCKKTSTSLRPLFKAL